MRKLICVLSAIGLIATVVSCGSLSKGLEPQLEIYLGDQGVVSGEWQFSDTIIPGTTIQEKVTVEIKNNGEEDLVITSVKLLDQNLDGTPRNAYVSLVWGAIDPISAFKSGYIIKPNDALTRLKFQVKYQPETIDANGATLEVLSNDPNNPKMYVKFKPFACIKSLYVHPPKTTFFNAKDYQPETKTFRIYNDGTCDVTVNNVDFGGPTSVFTLSRAWPNGSTIKPSDGINDPNADFLEFKVKYAPTGGCGSDQTVVFVESDVPGKSKIGVSMDTTCEDCSYKVSYDHAPGNNYLDFTSGIKDGKKTVVVNVLNDGDSSFKIIQNGISFPGDTSWDDKENPQAPHYSHEVCLPGNGPGQETCVAAGKTVSIQSGMSLDIKVTYTTGSSTEGVDSKLKVRYDCSGVSEFIIPTRAGSPKPCYDFAPGTGNNPTVIQFIGNKGSTTKRDFVVYNCGGTPLSITDIKIEDQFYPNVPSKNWTMSPAFSSQVDIPVNGLQLFSIDLTPDANAESKTNGILYLTYLGTGGAETLATAVELQAHIGLDDTVTAPTANPGKTEDYAGAAVGENVTLSGSQSTAGSEGLADKGYLWYLKSKPAGSSLIVNGSPSNSALTFIPDQEGAYEFGLRVHGASGLFLYSEEATVTVNVAAAQ